MTLKDLNIGETAVVGTVGGEGALRQHFLDMGLIPGEEVTLVKFAPMGDPMELSIHGYELTLRLDDAARIGVTLAKAPAAKKAAAESEKPVEHPGLGEGGRYHTKKGENPLPDGTTLTFALAGNQNCGKTTLFNQLTGSNQHVGNFPGVTVDRKSGAIRNNPNTEVTDLPGIYSMSPYTSEEIVTRQFIIGEKPTGIINIVDATNIERNLYLTMQLMELDTPMVLALNMMDEMRGNGGTVRINKMEAMLGIPVVPISAAKNEGVDELVDHALHVAKYQERPGRMDFCGEEDHGGAVHRCIHGIIHLIEDHAKAAGIPVRFAATKLVEGDQRIEAALKLDQNEKEMIEHIIVQMEQERGLDRAAAIADMRFHFIHQLVDEVEPHIRDGGGAVQTPLLLHLDDDVLDHLFFVLVELQGRLDALVALHELCGRKAHRDACGLGMILDQVDDAVDAAVDGAAVILLAAEIHPARPLLILCDMERMVHQLVHALVLCRRDGHDRDAQHGLHLIDADSAAVAAHLVHHVQRQHHRRIQLHELHGEVQIPLDVGGVHDIDDARGLLADDELPGHDLLAGIGRHGIDAGQVCDLRIRVIPDRTALAVHRHTREIADVLVGAGELVEEGRLAAVLVARQRKGKGRAVGQRVLALFGVVAAAFAEARVLHRLFTFCRRLFRRRGFGQSDPDAGGIVQPEGQLVAVDAQLHRVAHGGKFDQRDLLTGDQPHIQKMLPQSPFAAHGPDHGGLADVQIFQRHMECSSRARLLVCINNSNIG